MINLTMVAMVMKKIQLAVRHTATQARLMLGMPSVISEPLRRNAVRLSTVLLLSLGMTPCLVQAQTTVCARVKIEIKQKLSLERQAFDAEMKINNTTDSGAIENISVVIKVTDEAGTPVIVTDNPNDLSAKFYVRLSNKQNISDVNGTGAVAAKTTSTINWLLIPAPGSAGNSPFGKKYLVGATLKYKFGAEESVLDVAPDVITVKPLPLLTLDYFLPKDVWADDPLTTEVEATEPFTLGVRVKNNGFATAKDLKIDSAQPKIIENKQGLLINFLLTGSYVNDAPVQNTLLVNFADVAANTSKMGRWNMETTLAGKFTEFTAKFSHADELGGALTSILQATNAHVLIRDVRVDLPGRDAVRDFLARDGDVIRLYESDSTDSEVTDRSSSANLLAGASNNGNASYRLTFPATAGFVYVKLPDPFNGTKTLGQIVRSDAKQLSLENVWLSKTRNEQTKKIEYWINFFDVNSTGVYDSEFQAPAAAARAPVIQFIPNRVTKESKQVSFLVEASSPDGKTVVLAAMPLPQGATFTPQTATQGVTRGIFDWTPAKGTAGNYLINYSATDGTLSAVRSASISVEVDSPPPGPGTPVIVVPLSGAQVTSLKPAISVQTSTNPQDPTKKVQFELYADAAATQLVASGLLDKALPTAGNGADPVGVPTIWTVPDNLSDNTNYWWRARGFDGSLYSPWANARFFVNTFNDAPDNFNLTNPAPNAEVATLTPNLAWTNSLDKDGDAMTYSLTVYKDAALKQVVAQANDLPENVSGSTSWTVLTPLLNHTTYYWRVVAKDALGAQTASSARPFVTNTGNTAPSTPIILSPAAGSESDNPNTTLTIQNSSDAENDLLTYVFEIDTVNTFDSSDKRSSGQVIQSGNGNTSWLAANLVENKRYWWRVKAQDGRAESAWTGADFLMNAVNEAPPVPTIKNPGNGAWMATQQPSLEANPVVDPDGQVVRYQFEVYKNAALTQKVTDGISPNTSLIMPLALADKSTHWWRVRALDAREMASPWSAPAVLYVSTAPYQNPSIAVTSPAQPLVPEIVVTPTGNKKQATIRWEGTDPNIEPTVALYYSKDRTSYAGTLIVDGLRQASGAQSGSYVWDVSTLAPGAYYVYAVIFDAKGSGKAYAPGAVVIPNPVQSGTVTLAIMPKDQTGSITDGESYQAKITWNGASGKKMTFPISGIYHVWGAMTSEDTQWGYPNLGNGTTGIKYYPIVIPYQCNKQGMTSAPPKLGSILTEDLNFAGRNVVADNAKNVTYSASNTGDESLRVCEIRVISERKLNATQSEFTVSAKLSNLGAAIVKATVSPVPARAGMTGSGSLEFSTIAAGEVGSSQSVVTIRAEPSKHSISEIMTNRLKWTVQVTR